MGSNKGPRVPMHFFKVQRNKKYLFRLIGGSCLACPLIFTVEKHTLQVLAADGTNVEPFTVDTVTMFPGILNFLYFGSDYYNFNLPDTGGTIH